METLQQFLTKPWVIGIGGSAIVALSGWLLTRLFRSKKNESESKPSITQQAKVEHGGTSIQVGGDYHHTEEKKTTSQT